MLICGIVAFAQFMDAGAAVAQSFPLIVGNTEARVEGVAPAKVDRTCLTKALGKIRELYPNGLDQIKTELTADHEVVKKLLRGPHAILPLENSKLSLAISLNDDANVIIPFEKWKAGEPYAWYSAAGKSTGIASCLK